MASSMCGHYPVNRPRMKREEGSGGAEREIGSSVAPSVDREESTSSSSSGAAVVQQKSLTT